MLRARIQRSPSLLCCLYSSHSLLTGSLAPPLKAIPNIPIQCPTVSYLASRRWKWPRRGRGAPGEGSRPYLRIIWLIQRTITGGTCETLACLTWCLLWSILPAAPAVGSTVAQPAASLEGEVGLCSNSLVYRNKPTGFMADLGATEATALATLSFSLSLSFRWTYFFLQDIGESHLCTLINE